MSDRRLDARFFLKKTQSGSRFLSVCVLCGKAQRRKIGFRGFPCSPASFLVLACALTLIGVDDLR